MTADLRDLELLVAVVDAGTITAGAAACGLSLSAASARISALEAHYRCSVFERGRRGVVPTPAGAALAERARGLLGAADRLETEMAARADGVSHVVRIAAGSAGIDSLPELLAAALNRMPDVRVELSEISSEQAVEQVNAGRADIGVVSSAVPFGGCASRPLWDDDLVVIGTPGSRERSVGLGEALAEPVVALTPEVPLQRLIQRHVRRAGLRPTYRIRLPSLAAVCQVAGTGVGPAIVPRRSALQHGVSARSLSPLAEPWARRTSTLLARDFDALGPATLRFVDLLLHYRDEIDGPRG